MDEKDIQTLLQLAERLLHEPLTPKQALQNLVDAGIFDRNGQLTAPYQEILDEAE